MAKASRGKTKNGIAHFESVDKCKEEVSDGGGACMRVCVCVPSRCARAAKESSNATSNRKKKR